MCKFGWRHQSTKPPTQKAVNSSLPTSCILEANDDTDICLYNTFPNPFKFGGFFVAAKKKKSYQYYIWCEDFTAFLSKLWLKHWFNDILFPPFFPEHCWLRELAGSYQTPSQPTKLNFGVKNLWTCSQQLCWPHIWKVRILTGLVAQLLFKNIKQVSLPLP